MSFNSYTYIIIFLPIVFFIYFIINKLNSDKLSQIFLIISSLIFYTHLEINNLYLILASIFINYAGYLLLLKKKARKFTLAIFILINLTLLGYYKYYDFVLGNFFNLVSKDYTNKNLIIPLAISFFTFQQIAFLVETYKKSILKVNFIDEKKLKDLIIKNIGQASTNIIQNLKFRENDFLKLGCIKK